MVMTEASIDSGLTRDLYIAMGELRLAMAIGSSSIGQALCRLDLGGCILMGSAGSFQLQIEDIAGDLRS